MSPRLAIVGGGLTGAAAAMALLRRVTRPFELVIIEPEGELGRGVAYGKAEPFHLLNVRAGKLGVIAGRAGDFADWAGESGQSASRISLAPFSPAASSVAMCRRA